MAFKSFSAPDDSADGHTADVTNARDIDSESDKPKLSHSENKSDRPSKKQKTSTPGITSMSSTSAVTTMLQCLSASALHSLPTNEVSTFVPSSVMMYFVVNEMDALLSVNRYWSSRSVLWSPLVSRLYFGTLFYIQTMKCMRAVGKLSIGLRNLLSQFEDTFDEEHLPIPGPLVPFFKALAACDTPFPEFGPVCPVLPATCGATAARRHLLPDDVFCLLPNLPGIRRGMITMKRAQGSNAFNYDHDLGDSQATHNAGVPRAHNAANSQAANANISPGVMNPIPWDDRTANNFQRYPSRIRIPDLPNVGVDWKGFLGFSNDIEWFGQIIELMQPYAKYWSGSTTLKNCSAFNGSTALILCTITSNFVDRNAHRAANAVVAPFSAEASTPMIPDDELSSRLAMFTQINVVLPPNYGPNDNIGAIGTTRFGPWWNCAPTRAISANYNPSNMVGSVISNFLALERPSNLPTI